MTGLAIGLDLLETRRFFQLNRLFVSAYRKRNQRGCRGDDECPHDPTLCVQRDALHHVVVVAGRIKDEFSRLTLPKLIGGVHHHSVLALPGGDVETPRTERKAAEILSELNRGPCLATIGGNLHRTDSIAAIPCNAADNDPAGLHLGPVAMARDQRVHHHFGDWRGGRGLLTEEAISER